MRTRLIITSVLLALALTAAALARAEEPRSPLLMKGKQTLFQRVLAKPDAKLAPAPGAAPADAVTPFTVFYVYEREVAGDTEWLQVGLDSHGSLAGWLPAGETIEWNQGLTVAFRDPAGQDRVLLFRDRDSLKALVEDRDLEAYDRLYTAAEQGTLPEDSPVVAIQPSAHVDILRDFYLVPIRRYEDVYLGSERARMLEVASVPLETAPSDTATAPGEDRRYRSGIVFVIDSTLSMEPYIQRTREAVRKIYETLDQARLTGDVSFGLVAFRDNPSAVDGLDYLTRSFATLEDGRDARTFFTRVNELRAARVSSEDFIEDAYAGVRQAIEDIDWEGHDARYVVLITDAGARPAGDPLGSTGLSAGALQRLAQDKGIAISVLHLLTPAGAPNHESAEAQYRDLSHFPGIGDFYYGVETGKVGTFGRVLDALARQITDQVRDAANGVPPMRVAAEEAARSDDAQLAALQAKVAKLGYALRMRYLQAGDGGRIPEVFDAWLVDRDFRDPRREAVDVRVLLTRDQLSDLHYVMRQVLQTAEEGLLSPRNFLNDLKSLAATIARDPERLGMATRTSGGTGNLADMGFMREYIEGLPYTGEVMSLSLEDWQDWPAKRQLELIHGLEEKIGYYRALHDHTDLWVSLDGGPVDGDSVFPVALEMLP
ncbi:MAG: vWA domain-containing protein [Chromatiales bacterium]|jgi:hypothetical protein